MNLESEWELPKELIEFIRSRTGYPKEVIEEILRLERKYYRAIEEI